MKLSSSSLLKWIYLLLCSEHDIHKNQWRDYTCLVLSGSRNQSQYINHRFLAQKAEVRNEKKKFKIWESFVKGTHQSGKCQIRWLWVSSAFSCWVWSAWGEAVLAASIHSLVVISVKIQSPKMIVLLLSSYFFKFFPLTLIGETRCITQNKAFY